jgi:ferredoxin
VSRHHAASRLHIDPSACQGVGVCAHLAPDLITLDSWGYPIIAAQDLSGSTRRQAAGAVTGCPKRALYTAEGTSD